MGRMNGKVAFITGAARGQGRSHAARLAEEGADIIAVDLCQDVASLTYRLAQPEDLEETTRLVEKHGRRIIATQADVRNVDQLKAALAAGVSELGRLDVVVANAGVVGIKGQPPLDAWCDTINTNLVGVINTVQAALPHLAEGASIIATGSTAALMDTAKKDDPGRDPGGSAYVHAKRAIAGYVHDLAGVLAARNIRVNVVHPTNTNTDLIHNDATYQSFRPDLPHPTRADAEPAFMVQQAMPIPYVDPLDISNAVLFLASDEARYITGTQLRVDGGGYLKWYDYHI
ncbi:mycofactocin-coupled SDR family oxidoreductase [Mycobacterium neglectum]|jgi:SDR family mycofactocin-dependent oxidoreductase|uniref:mycofactocin-coupled SDR family oxidoreductase n=1 Tax=Mycobacterium neglectum TaxID=242737 RepID=UPI000BFF05EC|nr:mycofactocin-coupled SDR family oxidoreductase [Mycobacterium neglectum]